MAVSLSRFESRPAALKRPLMAGSCGSRRIWLCEAPAAPPPPATPAPTPINPPSLHSLLLSQAWSIFPLCCLGLKYHVPSVDSHYQNFLHLLPATPLPTLISRGSLTQLYRVKRHWFSFCTVRSLKYYVPAVQCHRIIIFFSSSCEVRVVIY